MKYSHLFTKTQKEIPAQESAKNAELLLRAGFIRKEMAGVYSYLPLGLRVLRKIESIVRSEMDAAGVQEILMPALANKASWDITGRWNTMDCLYQIDMAGGQKGALSPTHEETVTPLLQYYAHSYKDFPVAVYQIQTKFRNEARAKSGLLRGREFLMKDAYSFHLTQGDFETYYEQMKEVYMRIYNRLGLGDITRIVAASGGDFSRYSHEFQTISDIGEDEIYIDKETGEAFNKEIVSEEDQKSNRFDVKNAIEVGNIFPLSTKFSHAFQFSALDQSGQPQEVIMGCYGIGISRIMGVLAEIFHDEKGLLWPMNIAPFQVCIVALGRDDTPYEVSEKLYTLLHAQGLEVLYDDRRDKKIGAGQKMADSELLGISCRVIVSEKTLSSQSVEVSFRTDDTNPVSVPIADLSSFLQTRFLS